MSVTSEIKNAIAIKAKRLSCLFLLYVLSVCSVLAQPVWTSGPTTTSHPITVDVTFTLNQNSKVYYIAYPFFAGAVYTSAGVKNAALVGGGGICDRGTFIYSTPGNPATITVTGFPANTLVTILLVAESNPGGVLQVVPIKFTPTTLPCPMIGVLTGFTQPLICINQSPVATFEVVILNPDPNVNGVLKGTQWTMDWGDGNVVNYISTADNDIPSLAIRSHPYLTVTSCNYVFSNTIRNPCGQTRAVQYIAVVHGRDIASDGDGRLRIVNNADGSATINVCEGVQSVITIRDNSIWNCQNPVLPGSLTPVPNTDPRNIEWLYGRDPAGAITNTITGAVAIAGLGNAPRTSGRISPVPYGPASLSHAITIPATCVAGQYFRVYLKNWNKCNWTDPSYISTSVNINVIAAPPAPTVPNVTICFGDPNTLKVTSSAVGTLYWYSNSTLTTQVGIGATYNPVQTAPGSYDFWVVDQAIGGLACRSQATKVTLTIWEALARPGVITAPAQVCSNQTGVIFSVVANPPVMPVGGATKYTWTVPAGWTITAGQGTRQITVTANVGSGSKTISLVTEYVSSPLCSSQSRSITTNQNPIATINSATTTSVCDNTALGYTATSATAGCTFAWTRAVVAGITNAAGSGATAAINESLDNNTTAPINVVYIITPSKNNCAGTAFTLTVTVNPTAVVTSAASKTVCDVTPLAYTSLSSTAGASFTWTRAAVAGIANIAAGGAAALINESLDNTTTAAVNVTYIITPVIGGCSGTAFSLVVTVQPTAVVTSPATETICDNASTAYTITSSTAGTTFTWTRAAVAGISNVAGAGAGANINENLDNTTTSFHDVTYVITPTYAGCTGTVFNLVVTVQPTAVRTSATTKTVCDDTPLAYTATSSTAGATFAWTRAAVAGIADPATSGAGALINESLDNTTAAPVNVIYVITPSAGSCAGTSFNLTVTVNPTAVITSAATKTVCDITPLAYTAISSTAAATFSWTRAAVAGISNVAGAGAVPLINESLDNTTSAPVDATYIITPSFGGCTGTPFSLVVTVNPTTTVNSASTTTVCDITPLAYTVTSATTGASFTWTRALVAGISNVAGAGAGALINESLDNTTTAPVNTTYVITPSYGGCNGTSFSLVVTVNPSAIITSAAAKTVCSNTSIAYTAISSTAGATFAWTRAAVAGISNPAGSGAGANINESLINTTAANLNAIYVITASFGGCAGTSFNLTVTVHPQFTVAQLHNDISICNNTATNINIVMTGGTSPYTVNYTRNGLARPVLNNYVSGTNVTTGILTTGSYVYAITSVTDAFGCPVQSLGTNITITVGAALTSATLTGSGDACFGPASGLQSVITGGAPAYIINYTRNGVAQPPVTPYASGNNINLGVLPAGTYNYQITSVTDLCLSSVPPAGLPPVYTISIYAVPDISGSVPISQNLCSDGTASLTLNSTVNNTTFTYTVASSPAVGYSWVAGKTPVPGSITDADGNGTESVTQQLQHNYNAPVTVFYTVTPTGPGALACSGTPITRSVVVNPIPVVTDIGGMTATTCGGTAFSVTPVNGVNGVIPAGTAYSWPAPVVTGALTGGVAGAGAAISGNLSNLTNTAQTATYTVTGVSGACTGTIFTVTVTVNPKPVISNKTATICDGTAFSVTPANGGAEIVPAGTLYTWTAPVIAPAGSITGGSAQATGQASISQTLINTTNANATATYTVTPISGTCTGSTFTVRITVNPDATISNRVATICSGTAFTVTPVHGGAEIVPAGTLYTWTAPVSDPVGAITGGSLQNTGQASISQTLTNTTNSTATETYTVTPTSGACAGATFQIQVTVNPKATISNQTATICSGSAFIVTPADGGAEIVPAGTLYTWAAPVIVPAGAITGGSLQNTGQASISQTLTNTTNASATATYTVTPKSGACSGATFQLQVTVSPKATIANKSATICSGNAFTITPVNGGPEKVPAGTLYTWAAPVIAPVGAITDGSAQNTGQANISQTLTNITNAVATATYTVTPTSGTCPGATFTIIVTVNPTATISDRVATICSGTAFSVTPANGGAEIVPAGTLYTWAVPVIAPAGAITGGSLQNTGQAAINQTLTNITNTDATATYTVTPTSGACAGATFQIQVTVNPKPSISNKTATICSGNTFSVTPVNGGAEIVPGGTLYTWGVPVIAPAGSITGSSDQAAGQTDISQTLTNTTNASATATYTVVPTSGTCAGASFQVQITVSPKAAISDKTATICSGTAFSVTPVNGGPEIVPGGTLYTWTAPAIAPAGAITGGSLQNTGQAGISQTLTNTTNTSATATYTVTPTSGACAGATFQIQVTVSPKATIANKTATICSGTIFSVTPVNGGAEVVPAGTLYTWTAPVIAPVGALTGGSIQIVGQSAISQTLTNTTTAPATATYTVTPVSGACTGATFTVTVTVNPAGQVDQPVDQVVCNNTNTPVINFTTVNTVGATTYSWTNTAPGIGLAANGTGSIGAFTAINTGTIPVVATIVITPTFTFNATGCAGSTKTFTITVNPSPSLSTTLAPADICSNSAFSYAPASSTTGTTFNWSRAAVPGITPAGPTFGSNNPNETLRNMTNAPIAVTYQYTLSANSCSNVQNVVVIIKPEPVITAGQNTAACSGNALNFQILLDNFVNPGDVVTFTWPAPVLNPVNVSFTGGSARGSASAANITDTYSNTLGVIGTATYTVTPYKNGCAGTPVTVLINVGSEPVLDAGLDDFACSNTPIGLVLKETAGSVVPTYYNVISKTVAAGLTEAGNAIIPNATAPANYLSTDKFTNTTGVNLTVTYRVQPILAPNCIGAAVDVVITIRPQPIILPGQEKTVCSGDAIGKEIVLVPANTPAGTLFNWPVPVLSDATSQGTAGSNVPAGPSGTIHINDAIDNLSGAPITATYTITPVSSSGCAGTAVTAVFTIKPEPVPQSISGRDKICIGDKNVVYNVSAVSGSTFHWIVDAAVGTKTFDFSANAILVDAALSAGSGNITVYETNSYGCRGDISTKPVQVYSVPATENITGPAIVCTNSTQVYSVTNRPGSVYSWTIPGGTAIVGNPSASTITIIFANVGGAISVRETTAAGCVINHNPLGVTVNPLPTARISGGGTICDGGSAALIVDFTGTGPFTFTYALNGVPQPPVNTAADPYTLNVTSAGVYTIVNVSDANCTNTGTGTSVVSYFTKPTGTISGTAEMCKGSSATLTASFTGLPPFTFTYTDGTTPVTVVGHLTNVYTVSVSPLVNTTYTLVSMTDGNSCTGLLSGSAVISINLPPVLTLSGTNLICYNVSTGAVDMTITDGTAPFGISWTGPDSFTASTEDIGGLQAGYYAVSVLDTKGCTATANITLTQPPVLNGSAAGTNITCFGAADGTITISGATGGAGTFEFSVDGGGHWQASPSFTGLTPGTYNVVLRDAGNAACMLTLNSALLLTEPAVLNATAVKTDVNCFGASNGSIVVSAPSGGYGTYGYSIDGGATWQGSGNFTNLSSGNYNVMIRDASNALCSIALTSFTITQPVVLSATVNSTNISCFGSTDGTITVSAPAGGHGTYEYSINGGGSWQPAGNYSNLAPGTYNVQIRDAAFTGCYIILNSALLILQPAVIGAAVASTNVTCNNAGNGIINITSPTGGNGTYEYSIHGGVGWQASGLFSGLAPGTYDVRIRDAANTACWIILNAGLQITEPAALTALVIETDVTCFGAGDGVINITNSAGGYGTYQYSVAGGAGWQDSPSFTGLTPATYDVRIRDKAHTGCVVTLDPAVVISEPAILSATVASTNVTCFGTADGTITISAPAGGSGSYGYSINGGTSWQGSGNFINLLPGTYNLRIRDAIHTGCIIALNPAVVITQPAVLSASIVKTNVTCFNAADGSITINGAAGGHGTYEYTVNGGTFWQASNSFTGLTPGFYNVKIRDIANPACVITLNGSLNVTEPPVLYANVARTNVTCNGAANGSITISSPSGGYGTYQYSIDGGGSWQASGLFSGLAPGNYNVQISDAAHTACVIVLNPALAITEPAVLAATVTPTNVSCFGANNGSIVISGASGGYGTYEYSINGGTNWSGLGNFTNLSPATYDVRIRDAANATCVIILNGAIAITQPAVLSAAVARTNITCFGAGDGTITISSPAGGYGTYEYSINGGGSWQGSGSFTALGPGNYNVQIRDAAHSACVIVINNALQITQPASLNAVVTPANVSCNGSNDGIINITAPVGGSGTYQYSIDGGLNWQGTGLFNSLPPSIYDIRIRDAAHAGCFIVLNNALTISEPDVLNANVISTNITCFGANNGTITVTNPTGGYGTYEYSRDGGSTWQPTGIFTNLLPGSYIAEIRDKAHITCVIVLGPAIVITEPAILSGTVTSTNVSCSGAGDGTITISNPLGGYGTYGYSINGGTTWQSSGIFSGLNPATYNVRIRDAAYPACAITLNAALVITQPAVLSATLTSTNVTCNGANDGSITVASPAGGYGTYEYTINGGAAWQPSGSFTALTPGFYTVQIRDAANAGCVKTLNSSLRITEPNTLSANVTSTNVTCSGAGDGTITISSPSGGYGTYRYSIDGGASWQASGSFSSLAPATYNVQIGDAAHTGCVIVLNAALVISQSAALAATVIPANVTCNGAHDGNISITAPTGGSGSYQYTITGGAPWSGSGNFTNLAPSTYNVQMRDAANPACIIILNASLIITQPAALSATVAKTNVSCLGGSDGTITISSPTGGYGTYEYSINGGGSWQASGSFTALGPGNYNVRIRDAAYTGCVVVLNNALAITQPASLNAVVTPSNVTCNGANDGRINITSPTGGYGTYQYSIDGGTTWAASGLFTGLAPATYNVHISDAANIACEVVLNGSLIITEPAVLNANVTSSDISCSGANNGTITVTSPTGGYGTYEYSRDGGSTWQPTGIFTNLLPGSYNVQIRDKAHITCVVILNSALVITQPAALSGTVTSTNVRCFGANNGTITIASPLGGYGTYGYTINGGTTWQSSGSFTDLAPATYNVRIRDAANISCELVLNAALVITQPAVLSATVTSTNVTCSGANDGSITVASPAGGYGTYEYTISGGAAWQSTGSFTALTPGFYTVQIRDAANTGCVKTINSSLRITEPNTLSANVTSTNVTCSGAGDGTITISSPSGGYGTYRYSVNGGGSWQPSGLFSGLAPGNYNVQISDAAHGACVIVLNPALAITEPAVLAATVTPTNVTCFGANNGSIIISGASGGYGTYEYSINGGTNWSGLGNFTNLSPATYDVRIRDAANATCVIILNGAIAITQPAVLSAAVARTNISCFGASDGTITISSPAGGYGTYEYSINGGGSWQASGSFTALGPGNYNVRIRDAAYTGCVVVLNNALAITQPASLNAVVTPSNVTCNGANDGRINITAPTGGYGTYQYSIDGGTTWAASGLFTGLAPATYNVHISDASNIACEVVLNSSLIITEPAVLNANVTSSNISCSGANNGTITVTSPTGGYGTYEYSRDGGSTWQPTGVFTNLLPGSYNVQIRDKAHITCVVILNSALLITQPPALSGTVTSTNASCFGANNGTITITSPLGGYGTYEYSINGGTTWLNSGSFTGLAPASYNVRIRDAANTACEKVLNAAVVITQPAVLSATVTSTNATCNGANDGSITVASPAGGYGTYEYTISGGAAWQPSGSFTALTPGFYNVQIRDAADAGCVKTLNSSLRITEPNTLSANVTSTNVTCNGAGDGTITISSPSGGYGTYRYSIDGGASWQASGSFSSLAPATYNVQIGDAAHAGCVIVLNAALVITESAALAATVIPANVTCNGAHDGNISITAPTGGSGSYQYTITGGAPWSGSGNFTNLAPSTYNVQMRDAANPACIIILNASLTITQPAALSATVAKTNVSCLGGSDGTITISSPTGGYGTYEYSINGGGSWQASGSFTALGPGNYNVRIRDAAHTGCVVVLNNALAITQPASLNAVVTPSNVTCNGANDGRINITAPSGGYGTYQYSIDGGTTWAASGLFTGLAPATYNVHISDAANIACEVVLNGSLIITEPAVLNADVTSSNISCSGANNGTITVTSPTGGYGTYEYSRDGGSTWQPTGIFTNLLPGSYNVQIRDKAHITCVVILNSALVITQPTALSATVTSTNVRCFGANNGTITITGPLGGYGTYEYSINGGTTWLNSGSFTGLAPATYNVRIRDAANTSCEKVLNAAIVITQPAVLSASVSSVNASCNGAVDGTITITNPLGGYGTYEYSVNGGSFWQASGSFTALTPGFYNVQIRDAANTGCVIILNGSLRITEPSILAAAVSSSNVTCSGGSDGTITIFGANGGYGTYEYSINGGGTWQSSASFSALPPATYNVQIRDAANKGCVIVINSTLVITQPAILSATVTPTMATCFNANNGIITITSPAGGSGAYQFSINGGSIWQGSGIFSNLAPGNYNVQIRDASSLGCVTTLNSAMAITQPAVLSGSIASTNVTCFGGNDGTITVSGAAGGYGTYEYSINGGGSWQSSGSFTGLTTGSYNILIRDAAHTGCVIVLNSSYPMTQPGLLTATVSKNDVTCNGAHDGTISITAPSGGYGTYEYTINGGTLWQASGNYANIVPGTYDVRIRDAAHKTCSVILYPNLLITEPVILGMTSTGNIALNCFADNTGTGTFYASGGTMPYNFTVVTNTAGATISFPGFNSQTFYGAGAGTVTVTVSDQKGCVTQGTIVITQPSLLSPGTIAASQVICSGTNPAQLIETVGAAGGPAAYIYQWQFGSTALGPFINISGANASQYTPAPGATTTLYYRRMVASGMCAPAYSNVIEIRVNPNPLAILSGGESICPSQTSILKVNMMVGTGPFELDIENHGTVTGYVSGSDIVVSPVTTTTYRLLRVRDANNCEILSPSANLIGTATVIVRALPVITVQPVSKTSCEFGIIAYSVTATGTDLTYQWFVNAGSGFIPVADGGIYFGATTSTLNIFGATRLMNNYVYHVAVTGCSTSVTSSDAMLTVNTPPELVTQPKDSTICMNAGATFNVTATGANIAYQWQVNKGAGFINVVNDANFSGANLNTLTITNAPATFNNYILRVVVSGTCGVPVYSNVTVLRVNNPPVVTLNPVNKSICNGSGPILFSANGSGLIDSLRWQVFSGGVWSDIHDDAVYSGATSQQLILTAASIVLNGNQYRLSIKAKCTTINSNSATLTVYANPVVDFSAVEPIHACGGVPIVINGNPTGGSGIWASHLWTGDVGPLNNYYIQSPSFNSQIAGAYVLTYHVKDSRGCIGTDDVSVVVDSPDASFTWDVNSGCTPATISFSKDMSGLSKFWWNFDDGSPIDSVNANPVHQFINTNSSAIEYRNVGLTVRSPGGCLDTYTAMVTIYPAMDATFSVSNDTICSGNTISFTALTGASKYFWDYGDGVSGYATHNVSHLYTNITTAPVVHTVTLTTTSFYNCTDVRSLDIVVMPLPLPEFSADPATQVFNAAGNPVVFTNITNAGTWSWLWTFGDGAFSTAEDPTHVYTNVGTFIVKLTASNAICSESVTHNVIVTDIPPVADFDSLPSGCVPVLLVINNTSLHTDIPGTTYRWEFGDGSISTAKNPTYTYFDEGTYRVELTVTGPGGTSVKSQNIIVYGSPKAYFEAAPSKVFENDEPVRFYNQSEGAVYYLWDFGDGDTSKVVEPKHKYLGEGTYDVTLWAYSANGCSDKYLLSPAVTVEPSGVIRFATVFTPNKEGEIEIDHAPSQGPEYDMFFFPPVMKKVIKYKLQVFNRWGVLIFETTNPEKPWNGYYQHKLCPQGVYVWYVEGKYENGTPFKMVGDITLMH